MTLLFCSDCWHFLFFNHEQQKYGAFQVAHNLSVAKNRSCSLVVEYSKLSFVCVRNFVLTKWKATSATSFCQKLPTTTPSMGQSVRGRTMILSRHKAKAVWLNVFIRLLNLFEDGSFIEN